MTDKHDKKPVAGAERAYHGRNSFLTHIVKLIYVLGILAIQQGVIRLSFWLIYPTTTLESSYQAYVVSIPVIIRKRQSQHTYSWNQQSEKIILNNKEHGSEQDDTSSETSRVGTTTVRL